MTNYLKHLEYAEPSLETKVFLYYYQNSKGFNYKGFAFYFNYY